MFKKITFLSLIFFLLAMVTLLDVPGGLAQVPGPTLNPTLIPKYVTPLLIPPVMPQAGKVKLKNGKNADYYEISVRQFQQQI